MTYILMDIDGVLNPFLAWDLEERGFNPVSHGWANWQLNAELHAPWLQNLSAIASLYWCSSWEEESNYVSRHFKLPDFPFVKLSGPATTSAHGTWKLPYVEDFLKGKDEKVVWFDDEFGVDAFHWAEQRGNTFLVQCDPSVGFSSEQYKEVLDFIN